MPKNRLRSSATSLGAAAMLVLSLAACARPLPPPSRANASTAPASRR